ESSYFSDCDRIDPGEGLIEQYKVRSRGQCPRDLNPAPLAAGKRRGRSFPQMGDCELLEQGFEIAFAALACRLDQFEHGANVLLDGQAAENGGFLRQITDAQPGPPIHRQIGYVLAVKQDGSRIRRDQADDDVEAGCFARAVWTQKANRLAP